MIIVYSRTKIRNDENLTKRPQYLSDPFHVNSCERQHILPKYCKPVEPQPYINLYLFSDRWIEHQKQKKSKMEKLFLFSLFIGVIFSHVSVKNVIRSHPQQGKIESGKPFHWSILGQLDYQKKMTENFRKKFQRCYNYFSEEKCLRTLFNSDVFWTWF